MTQTTTDSEQRAGMLDLRPELAELWEELHEAITRVARSGRFILGPEVAAFERQVASLLEVKHAIGVSSGTDALVIALRSLGIGPGDEVITTPFTFVATAEAICRVGAKPVFIDIDPITLNLDPGLIESAITGHSRAVLPVHLFGLACDMERICAIARRHGLKVVEDTAQAFGGRDAAGRRLGSIGDAAGFSFFPTKNLGAMGDGGLITTDDELVAETATRLRSHGGRDKYRPAMQGYNCRLDELQAAVLRVKLPHVERWNAARVRLAQRYQARLAEVEAITALPPSSGHIYHQFTVRIRADRRAAVKSQLERAGIATAIYYPVPLHQLGAFDAPAWQLPQADRAAREVLSLPMGPHVDPAVVARIVQALAGVEV